MEQTNTQLTGRTDGLGVTAPNLRVREQPGLTFDDVMLVPRYSEIRSRADVRTESRFSKGIKLHVPIVSSNMDTVTESEMAIAMARAGGLGVIHRFMPAARQAEEVRRVKRAEAYVVEHPMVVRPSWSVGDARREMLASGIGGAVVVDEAGDVQGIVTRRDLMFERDDAAPVSAVMTGRDRLVTAPVGTSLADARDIINRHRIEKLPLLDASGRLAGLITAKDIEQEMHHPHATKDPKGHLRVAAAVGVRLGFMERARLLLEAGADAIVVDIAHGDSSNAVDAARALRTAHGEEWDLVVGNVASYDGTRRLLDAGADAVKVGVGPGSICITRIVTGFGVPQLTAIADAAAAAAPYGVPLIADGGIRLSGDVVKALAAGAQTVMIGSLFAGTRESPGIVVVRNGRRFKRTRGMASLGATVSKDIAETSAVSETGAAELREYEKVVPEGVEAAVPYRGPVEEILHHLVGGLRSGMSYAGAVTVAELHANAEFVRLTPAGLRESGSHDVDEM
jgi:IMP dehydrogenase